MTPNCNISELINIAIKAAIKAGQEILDVYYNSDFAVEYKSDNSPLTIADKMANNVITKYLRPTKIPILSKEGKTIPFTERKNWKLFWLVDPLDGTKEFVNRNDEFTVNIALIEGNSPIGGVVYVPVTRTIYWANINGTFKAIVDEENALFTDIQQLPLTFEKENFVIVGSKSHMNSETESFIKTIDTKGKSIEIKLRGSSLKICMVAEGNADVYPRFAPTMEWDTAAGHTIVKFAGKNIYQFENKEPLSYNKENLLKHWFLFN